MQSIAIRWTQVQPMVGAYIFSLVPNFHDSEDVLQRVAATVITKADEYDPSRPFVAWVMGIARIEALRHRSKQGRDRLVFDEDVLDRLCESYVHRSDRLDDFKEALVMCLGRIKGKSRSVMDLHYIREQSPSNIAEQFGMTTNAVFVMLHRVRVSLRECINSRMGITKGGQ